MDNSSINNNKPCLVQTAQGFTVSYKNRFLYSKYNPSKAINQIIAELKIEPQTLILCVSPVLTYGLKELAQKLPPDCLLLGCEIDPALREFMKQLEVIAASPVPDSSKYTFLEKEELFELGPLLTKPHVTLKSGYTLPPPGTFRRIIRIDFSAIDPQSNTIYEKVMENATNALMTFWANRVTLVKFGRKYTTNFFKNLSILTDTTPITKFFASVEKPIIVFGAGESALDGIKKIKKECSDGTKKYFILCADTALQPLVKSGIIPDGVFIEEAQNVISKCFIGMSECGTHIFAGLSSVHSITRFFKPVDISFFTTQFVNASFLERFDKAGILPPKNDPFGSVGISAWYYAMLFRKDDTVPVYTWGLDFAYSAGRTHTKGAMADNARFFNSNRIKNDANYAAAFCEPAFKKNEKMYTTPIMARYDAIMNTLRQAAIQVPESVERQADTLLILKQEAQALLEIKSLLTGEKQLPQAELQNVLTKLISEREYLFLHFPDGQRFNYTQSFLNRVRVEIDYFLKILK